MAGYIMIYLSGLFVLPGKNLRILELLFQLLFFEIQYGTFSFTFSKEPDISKSIDSQGCDGSKIQ
ncbi:hypothetical protein [Mediterraneibacter glycyrrhizinilyticus]|uniref:hypothetical protein n=1 Tax=Mediterraneibacter glycyrrhizinilyticus TaxID=342942 RepID=UPI00195F28BD|nr:hypothetical protein [Mediterraneibacter glycyrrhizinilyticus]